jgi:ADP-ribose pyrophosphatase YjhB (NUDIX family)
MEAGKVFLGGTTAGPDYRQKVIPLLKTKYFNPVVADWNDEARALEAQEKENCGISLYVITPFMEGVFSIAEIMEDSITRRPKRTILCILDNYAGKSFPHTNSLKALSEMAAKYGTETYTTIEDCARAVNQMAFLTVAGDQYLFYNKWLSLKKLEGPTGEYVYSHEERCDGQIVVVMPFRKRAAGGGEEILVRMEYTPSWGTDKLHLSCITGGVDEGEEFLGAAMRELKEESGFEVEPEDMISLGMCHGSKSSDTVYHLFAVDVSGMEGSGNVGEAPVDPNEKKSYNTWMTDITKAEDPLLMAVHARWSVRPSVKNTIESFRW